MDKEVSNDGFQDRAMLSKMNWNLVKEKYMANDGFIETGIISKLKWNLVKKSMNCQLLAFAKENFFRNDLPSGKQRGQGN